jgi:hypothetical protein
MALALSIPATYATAYGFMFPYGKLLQSLAESNLLPAPLKWTTSFSGTPYVALMLGSTFGFLICMAVYFYEHLELIIFETTMLSAFLGYISEAIGYIAMQTKFQSIKREFHSPLGIYGAIYCMLVFGLCAISVIAFQESQMALIAVFSIQSMLSMYYFLFAKKNQTFSPEESKILFVAHVITHNQTAHKHRNKPKKVPTNSKIVPITRQGSKGSLGGPSSFGRISSFQDSSILDDGQRMSQGLVSGDSCADLKELNGQDSNQPVKRLIPLPALPPIQHVNKDIENV